MDVKDSSPVLPGDRDGDSRATTEQPDQAQLNMKSKVKGAAGGAPKTNPKDPSRPRRKKARRACFACQRAHLTCGMLIVSF